MTFPALYISEAVCWAHKEARLGNIPYVSDTTSYSLRRGNDLAVPTVRTKKIQNSVFSSAVKMFNHLPENLKNITETKCFSGRIKHYFLEKALYNFEEFFEQL